MRLARLRFCKGPRGVFHGGFRRTSTALEFRIAIYNRAPDAIVPALPFLAGILALPAAAATPITLDQAMAHPDWIGTPVENAWWSWDGKQVFYKQKRTGSQLRDTFQAMPGKPRLVGDAELANMDGANVVYNRERTRAILLRNGDLFERDLKTGALTQITRGSNGLARAAVFGRRRAACSSASATSGSAGTAPTAWSRRWRCRARPRTRPPRRTTTRCATCSCA